MQELARLLARREWSWLLAERRQLALLVQAPVKLSQVLEERWLRVTRLLAGIFPRLATMNGLPNPDLPSIVHTFHRLTSRLRRMYCRLPKYQQCLTK